MSGYEGDVRFDPEYIANVMSCEYASGTRVLYTYVNTWDIGTIVGSTKQYVYLLSSNRERRKILIADVIGRYNEPPRVRRWWWPFSWQQSN